MASGKLNLVTTLKLTSLIAADYDTVDPGSIAGKILQNSLWHRTRDFLMYNRN
jgi:hypothetical protein